MRAKMLPVVLLALGSGVGVAQTPAPIPPDSVVRLSFDCRERRLNSGAMQTICRRERGVLVRSDSEGLTWRSGTVSATEARPWSAIRSVEVSRGKRRYALTGLWIGAVAGAVPGALSGAAFAEMCECSDPNYVGGAVVGALIFAVPAALLGAGIGALARTDTWDEVPADRLRVSVMPRAGGMGIGVAVRF